MSGGVMMKSKKTVETPENGEFMQLRSRRLYKSAAALMELKKRQNKGRGGRKRKAESVVEKEMEKLEENNVEEINVKVGESITKPEGRGRLMNVELLLDPKKSVTELEVVGPIVGSVGGGGGGYGGGATGNGGGGGGDAATEIEEAGENMVANDRANRESTPANLTIRPNDVVATGSSTRSPGDDVVVARPRICRRLQGGCKPSAKDMEDFFTAFERQQEKHFTEKYNFDFKNETPLPGRYEWVKVEP